MQQYRGVPSRRQRTSRRVKDYVLLSKVLRLALFGIIAMLVLFFSYFFWVSKDLPTPGKLSNPDIKDSTKILDKNGIVLYSIYKDYNRLYIPLKDIPKTLREATISTEDRDFYRSGGFSVKGYVRAIIDNLVFRRVTGGSGITQQLVKKTLLTSEQNLSRKAKELILSVQVDKKYSKDQILELYLNNIPYGGTAVGIEAASTMYFDKSAKDLNLAQAAFLAGLPQAPSYYSPTTGSKAYIERTKYVLRRMREDGYISQAQSDAALKEVTVFKFSKKQQNLKAPHFVFYIKKQLEDLFGASSVENGDLTVKTTLDYDIQKKAEEILLEETDKLALYNVGNGAVMVTDAKTGGILAMVGSKNYFDIKSEGNFNAATAPRQPGSSLKPLIYAAAFERGYTPATLIMDVKTDFVTDALSKPYSPVNYDGKYRGPVQARYALGNSLNIPAVKMLAKVGIKSVMQKAYDMGIENWKPTTESLSQVGLSLVLGGREASLAQIVSAYSVFADEGIKKDQFSITEVTDSKGKVLYKHKDPEGKKVLSQEVAYLISHILFDNNARLDAFGAYSFLNIPGKTVSVKTGTTDNKRDNWAVGYTPSYIVGVWVGNNNNEAMNPKIASGITGATPIWNRIMQVVLKGKPNEEFKKPENVIAAEVDSYGGGLPVDGKPKRTEYFVKGTEPTSPSPIYKKIKMSKRDNGKLASDDEVNNNDYDTKDFIVFQEEDPISKDGKNYWQIGIDAWIKLTYAADRPEYYPPTEKSNFKSDSKEEKKEDPTPTPKP